MAVVHSRDDFPLTVASTDASDHVAVEVIHVECRSSADSHGILHVPSDVALAVDQFRPAQEPVDTGMDGLALSVCAADAPSRARRFCSPAPA